MPEGPKGPDVDCDPATDDPATTPPSPGTNPANPACGDLDPCDDQPVHGGVGNQGVDFTAEELDQANELALEFECPPELCTGGEPFSAAPTP